jgi:hypothetical protein
MSTPPILRLNDRNNIKVSLGRLGDEENPVLIVDDVLANPDEIRDYALGVQYVRARNQYPGYLSTCTLRGLMPLGRWVAFVMWAEAFGLDPEDAKLSPKYVETEGYFGVLAPARSQKYRDVHSDPHGLFAMVLDLSPDADGSMGTAFWRHAATGIESACSRTENPFDVMVRYDEIFKTRLMEGAARLQAHAPTMTYAEWINTLSNELARRPPFPSRNHGPWELIDTVEARFNRLVVYPTWKLHSVFMKKHVQARSLERAPLTLNAFVRHPVFERMERLPAAMIPRQEAGSPQETINPAQA